MSYQRVQCLHISWTGRLEPRYVAALIMSYSVYREGQSRAKVLSNMVKQKRKEKAVNNALIFNTRWLRVTSKISCLIVFILDYWNYCEHTTFLLCSNHLDEFGLRYCRFNQIHLLQKPCTFLCHCVYCVEMLPLHLTSPLIVYLITCRANGLSPSPK